MESFLKIFICLTSSTYALGAEKCCSRSHSDTHTHTQSVGLLWTRDRPVAETTTWQHTTFSRDIHEPSGSRIRKPRKWAVADRPIRPRGHGDQPVYKFLSIKWVYYVFIKRYGNWNTGLQYRKKWKLNHAFAILSYNNSKQKQAFIYRRCGQLFRGKMRRICTRSNSIVFVHSSDNIRCIHQS